MELSGLAPRGIGGAFGFSSGRLRCYALVLSAALAAAACAPVEAPQRPYTLPESLENEQFWSLIERASEPSGYFRSENFLSNERTFQYVIPALATDDRVGGIYLGVGPEQNFTYIAALEPSMAIIVDIRRQNMIAHLLYKSLFEMSRDRAEFVSRLFSRPQPPGLDDNSTPAALFAAAFDSYPDVRLFAANLEAAERHLTVERGFPLDSADLLTLRHVYRTFFEAGPDIDYNYPRGAGLMGRPASRRMPSYAELMVATDSLGTSRSYLADEPTFLKVKSLHERNLIVPIVGNFAGPKALRAIGEYLHEHGAEVTAVYTSNVEQYLFQQSDDWKRYYDNLGTLPLAPTSMFIRSIRPIQNDRWAGGIGLVSTLSPMGKFLDEYRRGRVKSYFDVAMLSR